MKRSATTLLAVLLGISLVGCAATAPTSRDLSTLSPEGSSTPADVSTEDRGQAAYVCGVVDAGSRLVDEYRYRYASGELTEAEVRHAVGVTRAVFDPVPSQQPTDEGHLAAVEDLLRFVALATSFRDEETGFGSDLWSAVRSRATQYCASLDLFPGVAAPGG